MHQNRVQRMTQPFPFQNVQQPFHGTERTVFPDKCSQRDQSARVKSQRRSMLPSTDYGDCCAVGLTSGFWLVDVVHAPSRFSFATLSKSSNRSMYAFACSPLGKLGAIPFVRARPSLTKISPRLFPSTSTMT